MKRGGGVSGAVSLVMIFCVLCLAVFAVLTLSTADREAKLARLTAENAANYYEADRQAVELLAAGRDIPADVDWAMPGGEEGTLVDLTLPVGEEQSLEVRARLSQDAGSWEILRWRSVYSGDWAADETIEIWDGP